MTSSRSDMTIRDLRDDEPDPLGFATGLRRRPARRVKHPDWSTLAHVHRDLERRRESGPVSLE